MQNENEPHETGSTGIRWVLIAFLGIAGFFLVTEHRAHVLGAMPYVLLLACPFLHMFLHRGHGHHGRHRDDHKGDRS
jgi:hypothetical protein